MRAVLACASICLLVVCLPRSSAKEKKPVTKTIAGAVVDGADNPIAGAAVELSDVQDNKKTAKYSQKDGKYQFTDLDPKHDYEVQASFKGMSSELRRVSTLDDRHLVVVNFTRYISGARARNSAGLSRRELDGVAADFCVGAFVPALDGALGV